MARRSESQIRADVAAQYAETHARLATDPEYVRLSAEADREQAGDPFCFLARNRLALYVETQMPPMKINVEGFRS